MTGEKRIQWIDKKDPENLAKSIAKHVTAIEEDSNCHRAEAWAHSALYSGLESKDSSNYFSRFMSQDWNGVTENIIQQVIDTASAVVSRHKPRITVQTQGANWSTQQIAKQLDKFLFGLANWQDMWKEHQMAFRDCMLYGTGWLKVFQSNGNPVVKRVMDSNMVVDEEESSGGEMPRQLHQLRVVTRRSLAGNFPKFRNKILNSEKKTSLYSLEQFQDLNDSMAIVVESYHLPDGPKLPGRHVISVDDIILLDEPYTKETYPYVWMHWSQPQDGGFRGIPLARGLVGYQIRLNDLHQFVDDVQDIITVPRMLIETGSQVSHEQITDEIGSMVYYTGTPPHSWQMPGVPGEIFARINDIRQAALNFAGLNEFSLSAETPKSGTSGRALREVNEQQTRRFAIPQQQYERTFPEVGRRLIELSAEIYGGNNNVSFMDKEFVDTIDWSMVKKGLDKYVVHVQTGSILSKEPAGRFSDVVELAQYNVLSPQEIVKLIENPDIELQQARTTSAVNLAEYMIGELLKGTTAGELGIDNFSDPGVLRKRLLQALQENVTLGAPEEILENMRAAIKITDEVVQETAAQLPQEVPLAPQPTGEEAGEVIDPTLLPGVVR